MYRKNDKERNKGMLDDLHLSSRKVMDEILKSVFEPDFDEKIKKYIEEKKDFRLFMTPSSHNETLIDAMINEKKEALLILLFNTRADLFITIDSYDNTYLHKAMKHSLENLGIHVLKTKPEYAYIKNMVGNTFVHEAAYSNLTKVCKEADKNPELLKIKNISQLSYKDILNKNKEKTI